MVTPPRRHPPCQAGMSTMGPVAVRCHMPRVPHPQCTPGLPAGALAKVAAGSAWHCDSGSDGWHQPQAIHRGLTSECQRALSTARVWPELSVPRPQSPEIPDARALCHGA
jgi:hypothetical protein